jgi:hypothetical protein
MADGRQNDAVIQPPQSPCPPALRSRHHERWTNGHLHVGSAGSAGERLRVQAPGCLAVWLSGCLAWLSSPATITPLLAHP